MKVIKYNKSIQRKLSINIINYKIFKGKFIIYEFNAKGKDYNSFTDDLIYEEENLKGEKNGKGKEYYDNDRIKFEAEYLNGKRNGKGKEYYYNNELKFEGEHLNENLEMEKVMISIGILYIIY